MQKYINAVCDYVCSVCVDSNENGDCSLNKEELCAVQIFLPQIVDVIHSKPNATFDVYYEELKDKVCKDCQTRDKEGNCYLREDSNCSLDRYFMLIVDTVQKVDAGKI